MIPIWLGIIIVAIIVEIITIDLVSIWFAAGGVVALIADLLGASQAIQIALFVIVTTIAIFVTRPIAKKYLRTNIGKHGLVTKTITADTKGEVKVMSTSWLAASVDNNTINEGEYCEIMAIEGAHLVVKKIEE